MTLQRISPAPLRPIDRRERLSRAARRLRVDDVGALAVIANGTLVGVVSERDIVRAVTDGVDPTIAAVRDYMSKSPVCAGPNDTPAQAATQMIVHNIRHLPVVDENGEYLGMLSIKDVLLDMLGA